MIEKINASRTRMEEVEVFGIPALFTPHRVSRATVHLELFCYEMQVPSTVSRGRFRLTDDAGEAFYATVLTPFPVELPEQGGRIMENGDFVSESGAGFYTPAEFEEKYLSPDYDPPHRAERYGKTD
ncbi:LPD28 domain-containing protein [Dysosmobacter sp.]|jgi:hypothetical protein|uniref:LPD28 domain-containing protein n=1 Tax=Dysosmobacter sp. TaxID=2591382 RepID=UPI003D8D4B24